MAVAVDGVAERAALWPALLLFAAVAGCVAGPAQGTGRPATDVPAIQLPSYDVADAAFVKGNGSFGAWLSLAKELELDVTAHAADGEWILVQRTASPVLCSPVRVGLSAPFQPASLAAGDYLLLAQTASETELGFATFSGGDDFEVDMPGGPWNGTVTRGPLALRAAVPPTTWVGQKTLVLDEPGVVVVAAGTFAAAGTPASQATITIGDCANATQLFDTGPQPYPVWRATAALLPPGSIQVRVQVEGDLGPDGPRAQVTIAQGAGVEDLLRVTG